MTAATPNRRDVIAGFCGLMLAGFTAVEFADAAHAANITKLKNGKVQLRISKVKQLAKPGGVIVVGNSKNRPIAVTRLDAKTFAAFDLICPHQGVRVNATAGATTWTCPGHGAQFDAVTGDVTRGPADRGLTKLKTAVKGDVLTVG